MLTLKLSSKKAFGLVETLIAVAILALVLLVSVTLGTMVLRSTTLKAQITQATNLARQQLEAVRNIRDDSWLKNQGGNPNWDRWVGAVSPESVVAGKEYVVKNKDRLGYLEISPTPDGSPNTLSFGGDGSVTYYSKILVKEAKISDVDTSSGELASTVKLNTGDNIKIYQIESEVSWEGPAGKNSVVLRTYLSDWLPKF
jgi:type II secretory pathway pseudopilin PulG